MSPEQQVNEKSQIQKTNDLNAQEGRYIYSIIGTEKEQKFTSPAIGGRGDEVYSIPYQDIATVISASPIMKYPISRENTMAHQKVLEELMKDFTVLPVKFGTVAGGKEGVLANERIKEKVLKVKYEELKELLAKMDERIELGLKAVWCDMRVIFEEIVEDNRDIKILKERVASKSPLHTYGDRITIGEKVKKALERKKAKEEDDILNVLKEAYVDIRRNKIFGDNMITNCAFLVEKPKVEEFDKLVNELSTTYQGRIKFKYIGPVPPCNFVELVIVLEGEEDAGKT